MTAPECIFCATTEEVNRTGILVACERNYGVPCTLCQEHTDLDAELAIAKLTVERLLERRQMVRAKINQQHDILTTRLPEEIVSRIFEIVVDTDASGRLHHKKKSEDRHLWAIPTETGVNPLLLGSICRSWRRIAWSTPSLWSVVRVFFSIERIPSQTQVEIVCEWLRRSGQTPLSIHLGSSARNPNSYDSQAIKYNTPQLALEAVFKMNEQLINLIKQESERWEQTVIDGPLASNILALASTQSAHRMRKLTVKHVSIPLTRRPLFADMPAKPRPESVTLIDCNIKVIDIQWNHVTNVFMRGTDSQFFLILQLAPQLTHCTWEFSRNGVGDSVTWEEQQPAFYSSLARNPIHHSVQSLEIVCSSLPNMGTIFDNLTIPHLSKYKVTYTRRNFPWYKFLEQIKRSSCPLTSLAICHTGISYRHLTDVLTETPLLRELYLTADPFVPEAIQDFLDLLSGSSFNDRGPGADLGLFLPRLESFEYEKLTNAAHNSDDVFWEHVPGIFGNLSQIGHPQSRPLKRLKIKWHFVPVRNAENDVREPVAPMPKTELESQMRNFLIPKAPLIRLLALSQAGVSLDFKNFSRDCDLLELSMRGHGISSSVDSF